MTRRDRRARATGRLGVQRGERYALIPAELLGSEAWATLSGRGSRAFVAVALQYNGANNGRLTLPFSVARSLGITSKAALTRGLAELEQRGFIEVTRQGGMPPIGCTMYALTWRAIDADESRGIVPRPASNEWVRWHNPALVARRKARGARLAQARRARQNASLTVSPSDPHRESCDSANRTHSKSTEARLLDSQQGTSKTPGLGETRGTRKKSSNRGPLERARPAQFDTASPLP